MLLLVTALTAVCGSSFGAGRGTLLVNASLQSVFLFLTPALGCAWLTSEYPWRYLEVEKTSGWMWIGLVVIVLISISPWMNLIIEWNASLSLPESMSGVEAWFREMEDNAARITARLLAECSFWGMLAGVLVVGVTAGICEEFFFRGGIQRAMVAGKVNKHLAVWITAALFSAFHFQFFGFVPRMLLGALFGYLYLYSGSLWTAVTAHALNNSYVVVMAWLESAGYVKNDFLDTSAHASEGAWMLAASTVMTLLCAWAFLLLYRKSRKELHLSSRHLEN